MENLDQKYPLERIRDFAKQTKHIPQHLRQEFQDVFHGDKSDDFYNGLFSGLAQAQVLLCNGHYQMLPIMIVLLAEQMEKKEIV